MYFGYNRLMIQNIILKIKLNRLNNEALEYEIYIDLKLDSEYILDDTIFIHTQIQSLKR